MAAQAAVRRCPARCAGSPCRAAAPLPRRRRSRRLCSLSPAARRRRREAATSASCVRTSACSRAHARRRRASGTANRSAEGTARMARRCQEPCGRCEVLAMRNTCRNQVPGVVHRLYRAGQRTIECGPPGRDPTAALPVHCRIELQPFIRLGRAGGQLMVASNLPSPGSHGSSSSQFGSRLRTVILELENNGRS